VYFFPVQAAPSSVFLSSHALPGQASISESGASFFFLFFKKKKPLAGWVE
jgi:hypothetical protein